MHDTDPRVLIPNGTRPDDQDKPPFEVLMTTVPPFGFPPLPTATHERGDPHETLSMATALDGTLSLCQVSPLSDVPTT
jgi:hypothetical protein